MKETEYRTLKVFKALSNGVRYDILKLLLNSDKSTEELSEKLNRAEPNISQHLKILKSIDLVKYRTEGKHVVYSLKNKEIIERIFELENFLSR